MSVLTTMSQRKTKKEPPSAMSHLKKTLFGIVATVALVFGVATGAYASLPKGTTVTGSLKSGTDMTFKGDIDSIPITVSCTELFRKWHGDQGEGHTAAVGSSLHQGVHR